MVGVDAALPLPWLADALQHGLASKAHALLVHGPQGIGQFELATTLAQGWLCEAPVEPRPCSRCAGCQLVRARSHPDLLVLLPEALRESLGWAVSGEAGEAGAGEKATKAKPSKEIKVDAVRAAVAFAQTTSARGRGKVLVVHPAESLNAVAANTLLKTLEEPPGDARFLLSCAAPDALLPTIRSRCQSLSLRLPSQADATAWLSRQGVADATTLLVACGGQPLTARQWAGEGLDAALWRRVPSMVAAGQSAAFTGWPVPRLVETLQKLCHDAISVTAGAAPRYFPADVVPAGSSLGALTRWSKELARIAADEDHPWSAGLLVEALVASARSAHAASPAPRPAPEGDSLHSRA